LERRDDVALHNVAAKDCDGAVSNAKMLYRQRSWTTQRMAEAAEGDAR
jgi:hypothetical protein